MGGHQFWLHHKHAVCPPASPHHSPGLSFSLYMEKEGDEQDDFLGLSVCIL